jgi:hypothetical protein
MHKAITRFRLPYKNYFFRDPRFMPGWDEKIEGAEIGDATAAVLGVLLMFIIPKDLSFILGSKTNFTLRYYYRVSSVNA